MPNHYEILGVGPAVSDDDLKKAYRALAKKYHPDLNPGDSIAEKKFKEINEAYSILSDPQKRQEYDQELSGVPKQGKTKGKAQTAGPSWTAGPPDFAQMRHGFESFFGFDPESGEIVDEEKLKTKNPLDTSDLFERFMGFKK